ncbi:flagellar filament capping protein FliD [Plesiomonas shigelloides]|uniref:flagellar filament capping protein FliD n=1 Tax=Plesiomonas shigelloides TaxID=703 RepID=UPI001261E9A7|nr:flagellar filament capping protein FliD [Plesiomonas shigelloides]KAB7684992.1 flagellar filament capping protein FliD [Plesiomonas shigelloides]KAB7691052.1 flagellar filament capping protein FliD [Plesiomonas shigelloides]MCQ8858333.1 flagellar filament capping protein FliD [Plesiomonas shigelloides]
MGITIGGIGTLPIEDLIYAQLYSERLPKETQWKRQEDQNSALITAYRETQSAVNKLRTAAEKLDSARELNKTTVVAGDDKILSASVNGTTASGNYEFDVTQMAQIGREKVVFDGTDKVPQDQTLSLTYGGKKFSVDVKAGSSLEDIAAQINGDKNNPGVKAAVVREEGDKYSLVISGKDTGKDNAVTVKSSNAATNIDSLQTAQDAVLKMGSLTFSSKNNKFENIIDGISIEAKQVGKTTVSVKPDNDGTKEAVKSFVTAYNELVDTIDKHSKATEVTDADGKKRKKPGALGGDSMTRGMMSQLRNSLGQVYDGKTLSMLGIKTDRQGKLEIDDEKLTKAINENPESISTVFLGADGKSGLMQSITGNLKDFKTSGGNFTTRIDRLEQDQKKIAEDREDLDARLKVREQSLRDYYAKMDKMISSMSQTQNMLYGMLMG